MIDFIIPTFNRTSLAIRAANSCLYFCYKYGGKVVICDNNSNTAVFHELETYYHNSKHVEVLQASDSCVDIPPLNWLYALQHAQSKYVHLLFSDDIILPSFELIYSYIGDNNIPPNLHDGYGIPNVLAHKPLFFLDGARLLDSSYYILFSAKNPVISGRLICKLLTKNLFVPRSPCAFTIPKDLAICSLDKSISLFSNEMKESLKYGAGVDMLMILLALKDSSVILINSAPTVVFSSHADSITIKNQLILEKFYQKAVSLFNYNTRLSPNEIFIYSNSMLKFLINTKKHVSRFMKRSSGALTK
jgi:hypothetical protein